MLFRFIPIFILYLFAALAPLLSDSKALHAITYRNFITACLLLILFFHVKTTISILNPGLGSKELPILVAGFLITYLGTLLYNYSTANTPEVKGGETFPIFLLTGVVIILSGVLTIAIYTFSRV